MGANSLNLAFFDLSHIFHHSSELQESESSKTQSTPDVTLLAQMGKRINRPVPNSSFVVLLITLCFSSTPIIKGDNSSPCLHPVFLEREDEPKHSFSDYKNLYNYITSWVDSTFP